MSRFMTGKPGRPEAVAVAGRARPVMTAQAMPAPEQAARAVRPSPASSSSPFAAIGSLALMAFVYLALGRPADFFLSRLHLPLVTSALSLVAVVLSGQLPIVFTHRIGVTMLALTGWFFVTIPFSSWKGGSFEVVTDQWMKSFAAFVIMGALLTTLPQVMRSLRVMAFALLTASFLGFLYGQLSPGGRYSLTQGMYAGANELATAMVQGCIYWYFLVGNPGSAGWRRTLSLFAFPPILIILLRTGSRAAFLALAVVFLAVFIRASFQGKAAMMVVTFIGLVLGTAVMPTATRARMFVIFSGGTVEGEMSQQDVTAVMQAAGSSAQRLEVLKTSLILTLKHPIFGVGPGQFAEWEDRMSVEKGRKKGFWLGTHNTYTQISSETGIPGVALFIGVMVLCWRTLSGAEKRLRKMKNEDTAQWIHAGFVLKLSLLSYVVFFVFEHVGYDIFLPLLAGQILGFAKAVETTFREGVETSPAAGVVRPKMGGIAPAVS